MAHVFHHRHHLAWALVLAVVIVLGAVYHFSVTSKLEDRIAALEQAMPSSNGTPAQPEKPAEENPAPAQEAKTDTYSNTTFGYSLQYPESLQIKEYNARNATIGIVSGSGEDETVAGKVGLTAYSADEAADKKMKLEDYIFQRTKLLCDADGGGLSVSCPRKISLEPLKIGSGMSAYTLTLEKEEKVIGPEASTDKSEAVFFVVDLSTDSKRAILVVYPVGDGTVDMARTVAQSVKR